MAFPYREQRTQLRMEVDQPVRITLLDQPRRVQKGRLANLSGRGMRIVVGEAMPIDGAVKVDWDDTLVLGEVRYCVPESNQFVIGLELQHSLTELGSLVRLSESLLAKTRENQRV